MKIPLSEVVNSFKRPTAANILTWVLVSVLILRLLTTLVLVLLGEEIRITDPMVESGLLILLAALATTAYLLIVNERLSGPGLIIALSIMYLLVSGQLNPTVSLGRAEGGGPAFLNLLLLTGVALLLRRRTLRLLEEDRRAALESSEPSSTV